MFAKSCANLHIIVLIKANINFCCNLSLELIDWRKSMNMQTMFAYHFCCLGKIKTKFCNVSLKNCVWVQLCRFVLIFRICWWFLGFLGLLKYLYFSNYACMWSCLCICSWEVIITDWMQPLNQNDDLNPPYRVFYFSYA